MLNWIKKLLLGWFISFLQKEKDNIGKSVETPANTQEKPQTKNERLLPPRMQ